MKIAKQTLIIIFSVFILVLGYVGYNRINPPVVDSISESILFDDLQPLENMSKIIIKVKVLDDKEEKILETLNFDGQEVPADGYTFTKVEIEKIYKGEELLESYMKDNIVTVAELYYMQKASPVTKQICASGGYRPMKTGREYIMFLTVMNDPEFKNTLVQFTDLQGKFPVNHKFDNLDKIGRLKAGDFEIGDDVSPEELEVYKTVVKKVVNKYK